MVNAQGTGPWLGEWYRVARQSCVHPTFMGHWLFRSLQILAVLSVVACASPPPTPVGQTPDPEQPEPPADVERTPPPKRPAPYCPPAMRGSC
jgi:hypothetical protein